MRIDFLKQTGADRLILVFAGWSTQPGLYASLEREGWDLAVASGIDDMSLDFSKLESYPTIYLYAWSLGVEAASNVFADRSELITAAFAINGTTTPVNDRFGIPEAIFRGTLEGLDARNLRKFRRRMAGSAEALARLEESLTYPDDIEALKSELRRVEKSRLMERPHPAVGRAMERPHPAVGRVMEFRFDRAYISDADAIFPPANQLAAWRNECRMDSGECRMGSGECRMEIVRLEGAHLPDFQKILDLTIPDTKKIAQRFSRALPTYDTEAVAQQRISERLTKMIADSIGSRPIASPFNIQHSTFNILELGAGTGAFTRLYSRILNPQTATYIDLYECGPFNCAAEESYIVADGEQWLQHAEPETFDAILSASTIQWFVNPARFFENAARALKPGGLLACSSFVKGNLHELNALRQSPIIYRSPEEYKEYASRYFKDIEIATEDIILKFNDIRQLLMHLRRTGVSGSHSSALTLTQIKSALTKDADGCYTITYRPIYIIASRPADVAEQEKVGSRPVLQHPPT